jgi:hypothetical protein
MPANAIRQPEETIEECNEKGGGTAKPRSLRKRTGKAEHSPHAQSGEILGEPVQENVGIARPERGDSIRTPSPSGIPEDHPLRRIQML